MTAAGSRENAAAADSDARDGGNGEERGRGRGQGLPPVLVESIAGTCAGFLSTLVVHPLDLIKTRLQVDRSTNSKRALGASFRVARDVALKEGAGWRRGLYRGLSTNMIGNVSSWGLYFMLYGEFKERVSAATNKPLLSGPEYFLCSGTAGALTAVLSNPFWVIKTRMLSTGPATPGAYTSFSNGLQRILREEGPRGLFRGLVPALFGVTHGALQFMFYEKMRIWRGRQVTQQEEDTIVMMGTEGSVLQNLQNGKEEDNEVDRKVAVKTSKLSNLDTLALSAASKILAGCITYPYRVVQTRMQIYDADAVYSSVRDALAKIWRNEGIGGFYKGLTPNLARVLPSTCITFLVYENTRYYLR
ncbi:mitochondrial FAD carrier protein flx1 [Rhizina undulata]